MATRKTKRCKECKSIITMMSVRINYPPYGLFCSDQCINDFVKKLKNK